MRPLHKKLLRDLWHVKGQALAIMLVIGAGVALLVMSRGMIASLDTTMRAYYDRYRAADIFAPAKRAPNALIADIRALDGVSAAEGRILGGGLISLPAQAAPISARVVSIDPGAERRINDVHLSSGAMPSASSIDEALLLEPFARAHGLRPGDHLVVTLHGARLEFRIAGLAISPEFIYTVPPGDFASDPERFAVLWVPKRAMEAAYGLDGAFNEAVVTLSHGADGRAVLAALDRMLAAYGASGAYARADQISNKYLVEELKQLDTMDRAMTPLFLAVSAFLLNIVMTRLVQTERLQIGVLKAFGFSGSAIAFHHLLFALIIAFAGTAVGWAGGLWLGRMITEVYQRYFYFPFLIFVPQYGTLAYALGASLATAALGGLIAVLTSLRLSPAVAMRPPLPPKYRRGGLVGAMVFKGADQPTRMILRRILRSPLRAGLAALGVGAAMGLAVMMRFTQSATDYMVETTFNVIDRSDILVTFADPLPSRVIYDFRRIDGVTDAEPFRTLAANLVFGRRERLVAIAGLPETPRLSRALDEDLREVKITGDGVILARQIAETLGVRRGDILIVEVREGRRPIFEIPVVGFVDALVGAPVYMREDTLGRALKEQDMISGAYLKIDPARRADIYRTLKDIPLVAGVSLRREAYANFRKLLDEGPGLFRSIMTLISIIIAAGVVYNNTRIAFIERERDLATLRILGFTKAETGYVLLGEIAILSIAALPAGVAIGYLLWSYVAKAMSTDLYSIPTVIEPAGFGYAALVILVATTAAGALAVRDVARLDLVSTLKSAG